MCPACGAPKGPGPECPRCGAIYAKARARPPRPEAPGEPAAPRRPGEALLDEMRRTRELEAARTEFLERAWGVPIVFLVSWLLVQAEMGHFLVRTWLSMWIHELGHAVTAWFCGFWALPGPWLTLVGESRSFLVSLVLAGGLGFLAWWSWTGEKRVLSAAALVLIAIQLVATFGLSHESARALVSFGGDAGCLVLGSLLVATVYVGPEHYLRRQWLHWGFLVLGAAAVTDAFDQWWSARHDPAQIPFGEFEGSGMASDPSALLQHGWTVPQIVGRYVGLGVLCLLALAALWAWQLTRARARLGTAASARAAA